MKTILTLLIALFCFCQISSAQSVGVGTSSPDPSAQLDVVSTDKGVLIPRLALTATNAAAPVNAPATGLLVYNTATAGTVPDNVVPGFYYWNGSRWYPVVNRGVNNGDMQYWDGSKWVMIPAGQQNQTLTWCDGKPVWGSCPQQILTLQPPANPFEHVIFSHQPTVYSNNYPNVMTAAWTVSGSPANWRTILKYDLSSISASSVIDSAFLFLYADPAPQNGNLVDAHSGPANVSLIQRITTNWAPPAYFTWNTLPTVSTLNQVTIPQSGSAFEDSKVNMTALIRDLQQFGNNGFMIRLQTEATFNIRQYVSSFDATYPAKHPKLVVYYH